MKTFPPALILIDMQKGMADPAAGKRNNPEAESNIEMLLVQFRCRDYAIVHVRHISRISTSPFWPGHVSAEFQARFEPRDSECVFEKNVADAFLHTSLERWLHVRDITSLVLVGVTTNNSVEATARTAGNLGFQTNVVSDGTFTFDKLDYAGTHRSAAEVHAMSLANLEGEYASIVDTQMLLLMLQATAP